MAIRPGKAELIYTDRQTDMIKLTAAFRDYANASENNLIAFQSDKCYIFGVRPYNMNEEIV
jgi:hypothetical protein